MKLCKFVHINAKVGKKISFQTSKVLFGFLHTTALNKIQLFLDNIRMNTLKMCSNAFEFFENEG